MLVAYSAGFPKFNPSSVPGELETSMGDVWSSVVAMKACYGTTLKNECRTLVKLGWPIPNLVDNPCFSHLHEHGFMFEGDLDLLSC